MAASSGRSGSGNDLRYLQTSRYPPMAPTQNVSASASSILVVCLLLFAGGAVLSAVQGCRQLEEGTNSENNRAQRDSGNTQLHGCWKLSLQAEGAQRDSIRARMGSLPSVVELDTARAEPTGRDGTYKAYSWSNGRRESRPFSVWRRMAADSIRVQRSGALAGTMLHLRPEAEKLVGDVISFGDAGMRGETKRRRAGVSATSVPCPSQ